MADQNPKPASRYLWTASRILEATGGRLLSGSPGRRLTGVSTDSRTLSAGRLFIAITGPNFDGHRFAADAVEKGAAGVLVERRSVRRIPLRRFREQGTLCMSVPDTVRALGDLAAYHRRRWGGKVAAITGSNGKTATRKMTAEIVSRGFSTLATIGNYNNEIGVPLTLLNLCPHHQWAVVELGMNHPGEIGRLAKICKPDVGVITNVAPAHLEGVGSVEGVANAKAELLEHIRKGGRAVLNADDPNVSKLVDRAATDVLFFGLSKGAEVRATAIRETPAGVRFFLQIPKPRSGKVPLVLNTPGKFMVSNALAAAAVGYLLGLSAKRIREGLGAFVPEKGRMAVKALKGKVRVIDDTYNANPGSMKAAIDTLVRLKGKQGRCLFVLGDMLELGDQSEALHRDIGEYVKNAGASRLYLTGNFASATAMGATSAGMPKKKVFIGTKEAILDNLISSLKPKDWILVKGSRGMAMETVVQGLKDRLEKGRKSFPGSIRGKRVG